ncbi:hypothetical protein IF2G_09040 [Cordyceps javanica]|nr:hypothetical protein IF2G_09040 [Cordyceps javanica]
MLRLGVIFLGAFIAAATSSSLGDRYSDHDCQTIQIKPFRTISEGDCVELENIGYELVHGHWKHRVSNLPRSGQLFQYSMAAMGLLHVQVRSSYAHLLFCYQKLIVCSTVITGAKATSAHIRTLNLPVTTPALRPGIRQGLYNVRFTTNLTNYHTTAL